MAYRQLIFILILWLVIYRVVIVLVITIDILLTIKIITVVIGADTSGYGWSYRSLLRPLLLLNLLL